MFSSEGYDEDNDYGRYDEEDHEATDPRIVQGNVHYIYIVTIHIQIVQNHQVKLPTKPTNTLRKTKSFCTFLVPRSWEVNIFKGRTV